MYTLSAVLTFTLAGIIAGTFIGIFFNQRKGNYSQRQAELEKQVKDMQGQQQDYQEEVSNHFNQTAQLLNQLTDSYKDVHSHLAEGAQLLAGGEINTNIKTLGSEQPDSQSDEKNPISPPLDYASTSGTLSEDWGMEKAKAANERNESGYPNSPA